MNLVVSDRAHQDLIDIASWYGRTAGLELADRFMARLLHTLSQLLERPRLGRQLAARSPHLAGTRMWPVRGFDKYLVLYRADEHTLVVLRVIHGSRNLRALFADPDQVGEARATWAAATN